MEQLTYVAVFWNTTSESLVTFQRNLLPSFTTLKKKPADSFETLVTRYHNAWRHNPTETPVHGVRVFTTINICLVLTVLHTMEVRVLQFFLSVITPDIYGRAVVQLHSLTSLRQMVSLRAGRFSFWEITPGEFQGSCCSDVPEKLTASAFRVPEFR